MSNVPATTNRTLTVKDQIEKEKASILAILPTHINPDRFVKSAMIAAWNSDKIKACSPMSVVAAIYNAAELGLDFTPAKGHAYLVPFGREAKFIPGYRGLMELARRSGLVRTIDAHVVYQNDEFTLEYGSNRKLEHKPLIVGTRGEMIGAYAIAILKDGESQFIFMNMDDLNKVRKFSKMANVGAWASSEEEMYKKCPVRRLFKFLPSSPDLDKAIDADNNLYELPEAPKLAKPDSVPAETPQDTPDEPDAPPPTLQQPIGTRKRRTKVQMEADKAPEQPAQAVQAQAKEEIVDLF